MHMTYREFVLTKITVSFFFHFYNKVSKIISILVKSFQVTNEGPHSNFAVLTERALVFIMHRVRPIWVQLLSNTISGSLMHSRQRGNASLASYE